VAARVSRKELTNQCSARRPRARPAASIITKRSRCDDPASNAPRTSPELLRSRLVTVTSMSRSRARRAMTDERPLEHRCASRERRATEQRCARAFRKQQRASMRCVLRRSTTFESIPWQREIAVLRTDPNRMGVIRQSGFVAVSSVASCVYGDGNVRRSSSVTLGASPFEAPTQTARVHGGPRRRGGLVPPRNGAVQRSLSGASRYVGVHNPVGPSQRFGCGLTSSNRRPGIVGRSSSRCPSGCGVAAGGM
jgi:hypothetical protein